MVEEELRDAVKEFRMSGVLNPSDLHKRLSGPLAELMKLMQTPGRQEAEDVQPKEIMEQPLPTGQIPDEDRKEFSATN